MANEKRLIDANEALRMMENSKHDNPCTDRKLGGVWDVAHDCAISCVEACPTMDAAEVVYGEWIEDYETFVQDNGYESEPIQTGYICSECGKDGFPIWHYCPNCGAKMDSGENV